MNQIKIISADGCWGISSYDSEHARDPKDTHTTITASSCTWNLRYLDMAHTVACEDPFVLTRRPYMAPRWAWPEQNEHLFYHLLHWLEHHFDNIKMALAPILGLGIECVTSSPGALTRHGWNARLTSWHHRFIDHVHRIHRTFVWADPLNSEEWIALPF